MLEFFLCFEEIEIIVFFFFFELTLTFSSILECFVFNRFKGKYRVFKEKNSFSRDEIFFSKLLISYFFSPFSRKNFTIL